MYEQYTVIHTSVQLQHYGKTNCSKVVFSGVIEGYSWTTLVPPLAAASIIVSHYSEYMASSGGPVAMHCSLKCD